MAVDYGSPPSSGIDVPIDLAALGATTVFEGSGALASMDFRLKSGQLTVNECKQTVDAIDPGCDRRSNSTGDTGIKSHCLQAAQVNRDTAFQVNELGYIYQNFVRRGKNPSARLIQINGICTGTDCVSGLITNICIAISICSRNSVTV